MTDSAFIKAMTYVEDSSFKLEQWSKRFRVRPPRGMSRHEWEARNRFELGKNWRLPTDYYAEAA